MHSFIASVMLLPAVAGAQDRIDSKVSLDFHLDRNQWFGSENAAGLSLKPLPDFNTVGFGLDYGSGSHHLMQDGKSSADLCFDTQGALRVGKIWLWGHFRYDNITEKGSAFNTILYDPFDERQIFSVADPNVSDWKRQSYDMEFKAATRLGNSLYGGLYMRYADKIAAKQVDPRSESFRYNIDIRPAVVWQLGGQSLGLAAQYSGQYERTVPVLSNVSMEQEVFVVRGLGNYVRDMVGSGGLSTIYYRTNTFGGSVQYSRVSPFEIMLEAGYRHHSTSTRESATQPFNMGSTAMNEAFAEISVLPVSSKISADISYRRTEATEVTSVWSIETGKWKEVTSAIGSTYSTLQASLDYEHYFGSLSGAPYLWKVGGRADWIDKRDEYIVPEASFTYDNILMTLMAERLFPVGKGLLNAGLSASGNLNLSGSYLYAGIQPDGIPATVWYPHDISVLTSDYLCGQLSIGLSHPLSGRLSNTTLSLSGSTGYLLASQHRDRLIISASIALLF